MPDSRGRREASVPRKRPARPPLRRAPPRNGRGRLQEKENPENRGGLLVLALLALLSPQEDLIPELTRAASRRDYEAVESLALKEVARNPDSPLGWFYLGHARAARERFAEALDPFQKALDLGLTDGKVRFQLGYCAHRAGRFDLAVPPLTAVLRAEPAHQEARYWLGTSLLRLDRAEEAENTLTPLAEAPGSWRHPALLQRALARQKLGRTAESRADLLVVQAESDAPELRSKARQLLEEPALEPPAAAVLPLKFSVSGFLKAGYDSNVPLLSETSLSRGSGEGSAFLAGFVTGEVEVFKDEILTLRGSGLSQRHAEVPEADVIALLGALEGQWKADEALALGASLHAEGYYLDDEFLFDRTGLRGEARLRLRSDFKLAAGGLWMRKDFAKQDFEGLDSQERGMHLELLWTPLPGRMEIRGIYRFLDENAKAGEQDHQDHRGELGAVFWPHADWEFRLEGWIAAATYADPDPLTLRTRRDWREGVRLSAAWTCARGLQIVLEGDFERVNSTLEDFDSDRSTFSGGIDLHF